MSVTMRTVSLVDLNPQTRCRYLVRHQYGQSRCIAPSIHGLNVTNHGD